MIMAGLGLRGAAEVHGPDGPARGALSLLLCVLLVSLVFFYDFGIIIIIIIIITSMVASLGGRTPTSNTGAQSGRPKPMKSEPPNPN